MDSVTLSSARIRGPRLFGMAAALLVAVVLILIGSSGGASAAAGDANLALTKSDSPDPVVVGGTLTYTVGVQNLGPMAA
jgi:hypothetical protein